MASAAHHRVDRIAQCAFERVATQSSVHLHVPYGWLYGTAPLDHGFEPLGDPALLA